MEKTTSEGLQTLKNRFTTAPILHHLDPSLPFVADVDASESDIGPSSLRTMRISQSNIPVLLISRKHNPAKHNRDVENCELLASKAASEDHTR